MDSMWNIAIVVMLTNGDMYYNSLQYIEIDLVALLNINKNFTALMNNEVDGNIHYRDSICDVIF